MSDEQVRGHEENRERKLEALERKLAALERRVPDTGIISNNFLKRAFVVWGHYFVANLIIGFCIAACAGMFILFFMMMGAIAFN